MCRPNARSVLLSIARMLDTYTLFHLSDSRD
jgi:hypothetical protein